ncbi:MAG TPA: hypothetical protein VKU40_11225 [Thermoanaerobaculia bacterium]|nr:hypothetical protein [Thermoanaerobaculia bacterium]
MRPEDRERPAVELFDDFPWEPERHLDRTPLLPAADVFAAFEWRDEVAEPPGQEHPDQTAAGDGD